MQGRRVRQKNGDTAGVRISTQAQPHLAIGSVAHNLQHLIIRSNIPTTVREDGRGRRRGLRLH